MFDLHIQVIVVLIRERWNDRVERDGGFERLPNTLSKTGTNARHSTAILGEDHPVVGFNNVGASSALPRVTSSAKPSGLVAGAVAQGVGADMRAEAAEVLVDL